MNPHSPTPVVLDVAGTALTAKDRKRLKHPLVGGLILFARNFESREQLTALCADIQATRPGILIAVDHEGGRVQRFKTDGFTHLPPMRRLGELWMQDAMKASNAASACGYVLASELRACGVDLSFAPVLDLDWGPSGVIGDRAFHADARVVALLAKSLAHGMLQAGMGHCGKHFPGHGFITADSHHAIPIDKRSRKAVLAADAAPYAWLSSTLTAVMPAHVIFPKVDARPAGFSSVWLQEVLRGQMGFEGAIFSDDLSMQAARQLDGKTLSYTEAAMAALGAGCDMVLLCNQSLGQGEEVDELIAGLAQAKKTGAWAPDPVSAARIARIHPSSPPSDWEALMTSSTYQHALELLP